jgi:hypothetical protein
VVGSIFLKNLDSLASPFKKQLSFCCFPFQNFMGKKTAKESEP